MPSRLRQIAILAVLVLAGLLIYFSGPFFGPPLVTSFEECVAQGYAVEETDPRRCRTPDGRIFFERTEDDEDEEVNTGDQLEVPVRFR